MRSTLTSLAFVESARLSSRGPIFLVASIVQSGEKDGYVRQENHKQTHG